MKPQPHNPEHSQTNERAQSRFVYFGTPKVASDTLAQLIESGFVPTAVVTSPDAPRGRGLTLTPSPVKVLALEHSVPFLTPEKLDNETITIIRAYGCDYAICVAYGKIFPEELIQIFPKGVLNVHYSLLPKHRGATPLEAALLAGDTETGVTIQKMVCELGDRDTLSQETTLHSTHESRPERVALDASCGMDVISPRSNEGRVGLSSAAPIPMSRGRSSRAVSPGTIGVTSCARMSPASSS